MIEREGGCLCGAIRYKTKGDPALSAKCHCTDCQKQTGTAWSIVTGFASENFEFISGTPKDFETIGDSGEAVHRRFCGTCGSPIGSEADAFPGMFFIKSGTFDEKNWIKLDMELWTASQLTCSKESENHVGIASFEGNPPAD